MLNQIYFGIVYHIMSYRCDHCHKGKQYGHAVSHAKNRIRRFFMPNLQKLAVFLNGKSSIHVKFCTRCIKRLKKDGRFGNLFLKKTIAVVKPVVAKIEAVPKKAMDVEETKITKKIVQKKAPGKPLDIASIVGKKK